MRKIFAAAMALGLAATGVAGNAFAANGQAVNSDQLPHCDRPLGTAAVKEPDRDWWTPLGLSNPEAVLKLFALKSGCLRMVDRNGGLAMRNQERGLNDSGDLQRGSNIGRGQVLAADFFLIPDIARQNSNSGGGNFGGMAGHFLPGGFGAFAGSISVQSKEANTLITLVDARTTEQLYIAEGNAKKTDVGFGAGGWGGGWGGFGGLEGSGYTNTDIGKVIMQAYFNGFVDLVHYMQNQQPGAQQANAPIAAQRATTEVQLREGPSTSARIRYTVHAGALVYPTGQRNGVWMEVDDENGNRGWMSSAYATPR
ncbi:SH3 domain-containing protein [Caulobacter sp. KR2-114]|uniref:SH3 domain-containing protein n=1 Tax=Caulobacter sp. KR2-114 TaxID=3400912 RepID=UPI003C122596